MYKMHSKEQGKKVVNSMLPTYPEEKELPSKASVPLTMFTLYSLNLFLCCHNENDSWQPTETKCNLKHTQCKRLKCDNRT